MNKYRVLIIENDKEVAAHFANALASDFDTEHVDLIARAVIRLLDISLPKIDVIILDLLLPNGQGLDVQRRFNAKFPHIPLVVVTAMPVDPEKSIEAGAESILVKGEFAPKDLLRAAKEAIPRHRVRWDFKPLEEEDKLRRISAKSIDEWLASIQKSKSADGSTMAVTSKDTIQQ
jgi:DNA-binding response OmpR family regulator